MRKSRKMRRPDPARTLTRAFVDRVGQAKRENAEPPTGMKRKLILEAIFRAMPRQIDKREAERHSGTVEWRIRDGHGGVDIWRMTVEDGRCRIKRKGAEQPRTRIEMGTGDFLALVTGHANGMKLWTAGHITVEGDLWFAGTLAGLFRVPRRRRS